MDRSESGVHVVSVAAKRLTQVDLSGKGSNQRELRGVQQLTAILGFDHLTGSIRWLATDDGSGIRSDSVGDFTWYDARENHPTRGEYRLYYDSAFPDDEVETDDLLIFVRMPESVKEDLVALLVPSSSSIVTQVCWLFGLDPDRFGDFSTPDPAVLAERATRVEAIELMEALGLVSLARPLQPIDLGLVHRRFGTTFPETVEISAFARELAPMDARADPDAALMNWLDRDEALFRAFEERVVSRKLDEGFSRVDDFISFSLRVRNRRKSRMGLALEHHLRAVFDACRVPYAHQAVTENGSRPDFLFPSLESYWSDQFPPERRYMLAAKSTCNDRWRQVLSEARRIPVKHLCTLEPGISTTRTAEMQAHQVQLVVPASITESYTPDQREWVLTLAGFIARLDPA